MSDTAENLARSLYASVPEDNPLAQDSVTAVGEVTRKVTMEVATLLKIVHGEMCRQVLETVMGLKNADHFRKD